MARILVLGAGIAGSAVAVELARRGHRVTVVERDPAPDAAAVADPFLAWKRPGAPQFRLPHGFSARTRNVLAEHAPAALQRLRSRGVGEINLFKHLVPAAQWEPGDDAFTNLWARRAEFELALRQLAIETPGIEWHCPVTAAGLLIDDIGPGPRRVRGVQLADGRALGADLVLDCGGQRTPVPRWLAGEGVDVPADVQDCETVYYSRYYRFTPDSPLPRMSVATLRGEFGLGWFIGFPGDSDTYAFSFECHPATPGARELRHVETWEAQARAIPAMAPWVDPAGGTPLDGVQVMAGNRNIRRRYLRGDRPLVIGLLPVGDSLCSTNPAYGWGSAMALTYAFAAAEAVDAHPGNPAAVLRAYEAAVSREADALYREAAAMDRARSYRVTGAPVPEEDRAEMERQDLIAASLTGGVLEDLSVGRAFNRRVNLVGPADVALEGEDLVRAGEQLRAAVP